MLMNDIFGEENFIASIVWEKKYAKQNDATWFSTSHDYILLYARNGLVWRPNQLERTAEQLKGYSNPDGDPRGRWQSVVYTCNKTRKQRPNLYYPIAHPSGRDVYPEETRVWGYERAKHEQHIAEGRLWWGLHGELEKPRLKVYLEDVGTGVVPDTLWLRGEAGDNQDAKREVRAIFPGTEDVFDTPKPTKLIKRMLELATEPDDIIMDFFAGSGSTAQAVLELNKAQDTSRNFILVQLPEPTRDSQFPTIADICKERVRRCIAKMNEVDKGKLDLETGPQDRGFKVFKLTSSNFKLWDADSTPKDEEALAKQLLLYADHVEPDRTQDDILFELLLKSGLPLTAHVEAKTLEGHRVYSVDGGMLLVCLEDPIENVALRAIIGLEPETVLCLDHAFAGNDQLKTNTVLEMKSHNIRFHTV